MADLELTLNADIIDGRSSSVDNVTLDGTPAPIASSTVVRAKHKIITDSELPLHERSSLGILKMANFPDDDSMLLLDSTSHAGKDILAHNTCGNKPLSKFGSSQNNDRDDHMLEYSDLCANDLPRPSMGHTPRPATALIRPHSHLRMTHLVGTPSAPYNENETQLALFGRLGTLGGVDDLDVSVQEVQFDAEELELIDEDFDISEFDDTVVDDVPAASRAQVVAASMTDDVPASLTQAPVGCSRKESYGITSTTQRLADLTISTSDTSSNIFSNNAFPRNVLVNKDVPNGQNSTRKLITDKWTLGEVTHTHNNPSSSKSIRAAPSYINISGSNNTAQSETARKAVAALPSRAGAAEWRDMAHSHVTAGTARGQNSGATSLSRTGNDVSMETSIVTSQASRNGAGRSSSDTQDGLRDSGNHSEASANISKDDDSRGSITSCLRSSNEHDLCYPGHHRDPGDGSAACANSDMLPASRLSVAAVKHVHFSGSPTFMQSNTADDRESCEFHGMQDFDDSECSSHRVDSMLLAPSNDDSDDHSYRGVALSLPFDDSLAQSLQFDSEPFGGKVSLGGFPDSESFGKVSFGGLPESEPIGKVSFGLSTHEFSRLVPAESMSPSSDRSGKGAREIAVTEDRESGAPGRFDSEKVFLSAEGTVYVDQSGDIVTDLAFMQPFDNPFGPAIQTAFSDADFQSTEEGVQVINQAEKSFNEMNMFEMGDDEAAQQPAALDLPDQWSFHPHFSGEVDAGAPYSRISIGTFFQPEYSEFMDSSLGNRASLSSFFGKEVQSPPGLEEDRKRLQQDKSESLHESFQASSAGPDAVAHTPTSSADSTYVCDGVTTSQSLNGDISTTPSMGNVSNISSVEPSPQTPTPADMSVGTLSSVLTSAPDVDKSGLVDIIMKASATKATKAVSKKCHPAGRVKVAGTHNLDTPTRVKKVVRSSERDGVTGSATDSVRAAKSSSLNATNTNMQLNPRTATQAKSVSAHGVVQADPACNSGKRAKKTEESNRATRTDTCRRELKSRGQTSGEPAIAKPHKSKVVCKRSDQTSSTRFGTPVLRVIKNKDTKVSKPLASSSSELMQVGKSAPEDPEPIDTESDKENTDSTGGMASSFSGHSSRSRIPVLKGGSPKRRDNQRIFRSLSPKSRKTKQQSNALGSSNQIQFPFASQSHVAPVISTSQSNVAPVISGLKSAKQPTADCSSAVPLSNIPPQSQQNSNNVPHINKSRALRTQFSQELLPGKTTSRPRGSAESRPLLCLPRCEVQQSESVNAPRNTSTPVPDHALPSHGPDPLLSAPISKPLPSSQRPHPPGSVELDISGPAPISAPPDMRVGEVCCVGLSAQALLPLHNTSHRWLNVLLVVTRVHVNGVQLDTSSTIVFAFKEHEIVGPGATEMMKVVFTPRVPGAYSAELELRASPVSSRHEAAPTTVVLLQAVAESPRVQVLAEPAGVDLGFLAWGSERSQLLLLVNPCQATFPVRLVIASKQARWHCFSFETPGHGARTDPKADNTCVLNITLPGCTHSGPATPCPVMVHFRAPLSPGTHDTAQLPPEIFTASVQIELDTPSWTVPLAAVPLRACVGVLRLHALREMDVVSLRASPAHPVTQRAMPLRNAGNIPMTVAMEVKEQASMFSVTPASLLIAPHALAEITVTFRAPNRLETETFHSLLLLSVEPDGPSYDMAMQGELVVPAVCPTPPPLLCDRHHVAWGGVAVGRAEQQTVHIKSECAHALRFQLSIKGGNRSFQLQSSFQRGGCLSDTCDVILQAGEVYPVHLLFLPSRVAYVTAKLQLRSCSGDHSTTHYTVALCGYGGVCEVVLDGVETQGAAAYRLAVGALTPGASTRHKITLHNRGSRATYIRCRQSVPASSLQVQPEEVCVMPGCRQSCTLVLTPSHSDLAECSSTSARLASVAFLYGDELSRHRMRRALARDVAVVDPKEQGASLRDVNFDVPYDCEEECWNTDHDAEPSPSDVTLFYSHMRQLKLDIVGRTEPAQHAPSDDWIVTPQRLLLTAGDHHGNPHVHHIQVINNSACTRRYELRWPAHCVVITPEQGVVGARGAVTLSVSASVALAGKGIELPWQGGIAVLLDHQEKVIQVEIRAPETACSPCALSPAPSLTPAAEPETPTASRVEAGGTLPTDQGSPLLSIATPCSRPAHRGNKVVADDELHFENTLLGTTEESHLELHNEQEDGVKWICSSYAPAFIQEPCSTAVRRAAYAPFWLPEKAGILMPQQRRKVMVHFCPRLYGDFSQTWEIRCHTQTSFVSRAHVTRVRLTGQCGQEVDAEPAPAPTTALSDTRPSGGTVSPRPASAEPPPLGNMSPPPRPPAASRVSPPSAPNTTADLTTLCLDVTARPSAASLLFMNPCELVFSECAPNMSQLFKVSIFNKDQTEHVVHISSPTPPFYFNHKKTEIKIKARCQIRLPVTFRPEREGRYRGVLLGRSDMHHTLTLALSGSCAAQRT